MIWYVPPVLGQSPRHLSNNNFMKAFLAAFFTLTALVYCAGFVNFASAAGSNDPYGLHTAAGRAQLPYQVAGESNVPAIIGKVVSYALSLIGVLFFALILFAGFLWMSAMGNTEKSEKAKQILEGAIIGIVLVLGAYAITQFVFTGLSNGSSTAPSVTAPANSNNVPGAECSQDADCSDPKEICVQGKCLLKP